MKHRKIDKIKMEWWSAFHIGCMILEFVRFITVVGDEPMYPLISHAKYLIAVLPKYPQSHVVPTKAAKL